MTPLFNRVGGWRALSARDLPLLALVLLVQIALGIALHAVPVRWLPKAVARARVVARRVAIGSDSRIAWAIEAVGRRLPGISTCLVRALAADALLSLPGAPGRLRIGVRRAGDGTLESHAWFERDGRILVGRAGAETYEPFMTLTASSDRAAAAAESPSAGGSA